MFNYVWWLRSHYPEVFGIRKNLQKLKVNRIIRHTMPESAVKKCENNPEKTKEIIAPYLKKWDKYLGGCFSEMELMINNAPILRGRTDLENIRTDMLFCRLAYGFIPSEYIGFAFIDKTPSERKEFCSDLDTLIFGYSVNNIKEVQRVLNKATSAIKYKNLFKRDFIVISTKKIVILIWRLLKQILYL